MASILDNEKDIEREAALTLVHKTFEEVKDIYHNADLQGSIKLAGITYILREYKDDKDFPEIGELPDTYANLKQIMEYLRTANISLQNKVGELEGEVIELNGKIRALEIMLGWFVHEHSKLDQNPDHVKGLYAVMEVHGVEEQSIEKIHNYAKQFKEL